MATIVERNFDEYELQKIPRNQEIHVVCFELDKLLKELQNISGYKQISINHHQLNFEIISCDKIIKVDYAGNSRWNLSFKQFKNDDCKETILVSSGLVEIRKKIGLEKQCRISMLTTLKTFLEEHNVYCDYNAIVSGNSICLKGEGKTIWFFLNENSTWKLTYRQKILDEVCHVYLLTGLYCQKELGALILNGRFDK